MLRKAEPALRLDLDSEALAANWRALDRLSGGARAGAAVKADSYGLGAKRAAPALRAAGCRDFFVAHPAEAVELLGLIPAEEIAVLHGPLTDGDAAWLHEAGVRPVINSLAQAERWLAAGGGRCDLMVDTGINRLGLPPAEIGAEAIARLDVDVLLSHLACADEDHAMNARQLAAWQGLRGHVRHRRASLANSAGIALGAAWHGDLTRPGLALYGGVPRPQLAGQLQQVARPLAAILQVRNLASGESVGYGATFVAAAPLRVGVIAIGYADGYLRCWSGQGAFLSGGRRLPVLGRVSMDMTVIDLTGASDLGEGDWVEADYALPEAAERSGLSQYELLTLLGRRFRKD
jgi:alanine racemase